MHSLILSFIFILLPLIVFQRNVVKLKDYIGVFVYFISIGFAFMLLEMGIVQKFALFLGSPIYSMAVVIPAILVFAGLGSLSSGKIKNNINFYIFSATFICGILIFLTIYLMPYITSLFLNQPLNIRILVALITIAPLAFFMGFSFPLALRVISDYSKNLTPWALAINSSASVIASVIAIIIAIQYGFKMVLCTSAVFYLIASLLSAFAHKTPGVNLGMNADR